MVEEKPLLSFWMVHRFVVGVGGCGCGVVVVRFGIMKYVLNWTDRPVHPFVCKPCGKPQNLLIVHAA